MDQPPEPVPAKAGVERINRTIKGTPTVLILSPDGMLLSKKGAPTWRKAASRSEDAIFRAFDTPLNAPRGSGGR
jgi:hypothetical protein